jgi:ABC-2 type transport system permease protein
MKTQLPWLLKREYWENRGGFLWAPGITAGITLLLTLMGLVVAEVFRSRMAGEIQVGVPLNQLTQQMTPEQLANLGVALDGYLLSQAMLLQVVLFFVVFFYLLGALYDDRRDRSVLFWKSLPLSDASMVVSKVLSAAVVAPLISTVFAMLLQLSLLLLLSAYVLLHGVNPISVLWGPASLLGVWVQMLANIPINALWALPTFGWLLLVSAYARNRPFLWALLVPVGLGVLLAWGDMLSLFNISNAAYWRDGVMRILLGVMPGSFLLHWVATDPSQIVEMATIDHGSRRDVVLSFGWTMMGRALGSTGMWVGALAGIAMIVAATRLRRWRDEG